MGQLIVDTIGRPGCPVCGSWVTCRRWVAGVLLYECHRISREFTSMDHSANSFSDNVLVIVSGINVDLFVKLSVVQLSETFRYVEITSPHHHSSTFVRRFDNIIPVVAQLVKGIFFLALRFDERAGCLLLKYCANVMTAFLDEEVQAGNDPSGGVHVDRLGCSLSNETGAEIDPARPSWSVSVSSACSSTEVPDTCVDGASTRVYKIMVVIRIAPFVFYARQTCI